MADVTAVKIPKGAQANIRDSSLPVLCLRYCVATRSPNSARRGPISKFQSYNIDQKRRYSYNLIR